VYKLSRAPLLKNAQIYCKGKEIERKETKRNQTWKSCNLVVYKLSRAPICWETLQLICQRMSSDTHENVEWFLNLLKNAPIECVRNKMHCTHKKIWCPWCPCMFLQALQLTVWGEENQDTLFTLLLSVSLWQWIGAFFKTRGSTEFKHDQKQNMRSFWAKNHYIYESHVCLGCHCHSDIYTTLRITVRGIFRRRSKSLCEGENQNASTHCHITVWDAPIQIHCVVKNISLRGKFRR